LRKRPPRKKNLKKESQKKRKGAGVGGRGGILEKPKFAQSVASRA
jgi:hypothetical protein